MLVRRINRLLGTFGSSYVLMPTQITRTISCAWCADDFEWSGSPLDSRAVFCCKVHKNKARVARNKRAEEVEPRPKKELNPRLRYSTGTAKTCPRPEKFRHKSVEDALEAIKRVDPTMHPYTCRCGYIHIGH